jgi:hypothetical protein
MTLKYLIQILAPPIMRPREFWVGDVILNLALHSLPKVPEDVSTGKHGLYSINPSL